MSSCDNCNGSGCLPPDDDMHRITERLSMNVNWTCDFCGANKHEHNRLFSIGNVRICSTCINEHSIAFGLGKFEIARLDIECILCSQNSGDNNPIFLVKDKNDDDVGLCSQCIRDNKRKFEQDELIQTERNLSRIHTPGEIFSILNDYVIGQEEAKKALSVQVFL